MHVVAYVMTFRTFQNEFKFITPANNLFLMIHACSSFQWELIWGEDKKAVYQRFTKLIRHVACQERCSRKMSILIPAGEGSGSLMKLFGMLVFTRSGVNQ